MQDVLSEATTIAETRWGGWSEGERSIPADDRLVAASYAALAEHRAATDRAYKIYQQLKARLDPSLFGLVDELLEARGVADDHGVGVVIVEIERHFPTIAAELEGLREGHLEFSHWPWVGSCCSGGDVD